MGQKRVLLLIGDFVEDYEVMLPYQMLLMCGVRVDAVCPHKKAGQSVPTSIHDFEGDQTYTEKRGHNFALNYSFADVRPDDYDALMLPGGRAPEYLRLDPRVMEIVSAFARGPRPLAAICHGPQMLLGTDALKGRSATAYPSVKPEIIAAGGRWIDAAPTMDNVHVDGHLITGPAWPGIHNWVRATLEQLGIRPGERGASAA